jgi:hypothetical protein
MFIRKNALKPFTTMLIAIFLTGMSLTSAQGSMTGFIATNYSSKILNISDGAIDPAWANVTSTHNLKEFGTNGAAKFSTNGTHVFALLKASSDLEWISIEFDYITDKSMKRDHDGWVVYLDNAEQSADIKDLYMSGQTYPDIDAINDVKGEAIFDGDTVSVELTRPLVTNDTSGYDHDLTNGTLAILAFASNVDHYEERTQYYLSVNYFLIQDGEEIPDVTGNINIDVPVSTSLGRFKMPILYGTLIFIGLFLGTHFTIRVIKRPLNHDHRIVDNYFTPPDLKQRWNSIFEVKSQPKDVDLDEGDDFR